MTRSTPACRRLGEVDRRLAVLGREVAARAHRVDQVVGGVDALERLGQARAGEDVAACARRRAPAPRRLRVRTAWPRALQLGDQLGADVAGRAGDEDGVGFAHERCATQLGSGNPDRAQRRTLSGLRVKKLAIKDLAEQTGVAAGTIRMWEQRYGFPEPARTAAGYRDLHRAGRRRAAARRRLPQPRALGAGRARARAVAGGRDRPAVDLRRAGLRRLAGAPAAAAPADADRALAGDRGGGDGARRRARS